MERRESWTGPTRAAGGRGFAGVAAGLLAVVLAGVVAGGEVRASGYDVAFGAGHIDGTFLSDNDQALDDLFLQLEFGGAGSRLSIRAPYVRINRTGNVTFTPEGAVVLGAGGEGRPPWQTSDAGDTASGWGDVLVRSETYLTKAAAGNHPTLSLIADFKWSTADQGDGLGTGGNDYGAGLDYVQPLGKMFQIRGDAFYRFTGSPEGVDFNDRLRLAAGFGILTAHTAWRLGYETVSPILDEVPLYDAAGVATGIVEVEDYEVVRGEAVLKNQAGGSVKIWALMGLNDSSPDVGFGLTFASKAL
jgi:hypothetical protein